MIFFKINPFKNTEKNWKNMKKISIDLYWKISYLAQILQMKQILFFFAVTV